MKKFFNTLSSIIIIALLAWIFISYIDVVIDNISMNPHHGAWNFFTVFLSLVM